MAVIFGQGRFALGDYPSYGIILALLLLCEWHPRALHFAPDTDGFGGLALPALGRNTEDEGCSSQERWIGEVQETVKCSDRMSTMLVGCALTLSHELRVFEDVDDRLNETIYSSTQSQRAHIRHLIYLYTHLLADKPSFITILPEKVSYFLAENRHIENSAENEQPITQAWLELSELWNSFRERAVVTKTSGPEGQRARKCFSVVDHFTSLLAQWAQRHNWSSGTIIRRTMLCTKADSSADRTAGLQQIIAIEYHYVQIHCNSFGMQVQVDQKSRHGHRVTTEAEHENIHMRSHTAAAVRYAQNVTSHCCSLLETIMEINNGQIFRYAPVRVFMRTIAASVLLLKSLAIGMRTGQLQSILALLDRVVQALGENSIDDVHLARHYAKLLNTYIRKARRRFAIGSTTHSGQGENAIEPSMNGSGSQREAVPTSNVTEQPATAHPSVDLGFDFDADYWYSLPLGSENDIFSYVLPGASDF